MFLGERSSLSIQGSKVEAIHDLGVSGIYGRGVGELNV